MSTKITQVVVGNVRLFISPETGEVYWDDDKKGHKIVIGQDGSVTWHGPKDITIDPSGKVQYDGYTMSTADYQLGAENGYAQGYNVGCNLMFDLCVKCGVDTILSDLYAFEEN